jgi:threonine dehydrogenase-like Zn-dependent dehydrogenase
MIENQRMVTSIWDGRKFELRENRLYNSNSTVLKLLGSGMCGTDRHLMELSDSPDRGLGHEIYGEIVRLGPNTHSIGGRPLKVGDKVIATPGVPCLKCEYCTTFSGAEQLCGHRRSHGFSKYKCNEFFPAGGFSNYIELVDQLWVYPLPDDITLSEIMFADLVPIALKAIERGIGGGRQEAQFGPGVAMRLGVIGLGPIGAAAVFIGKTIGATVTGMDISPWKAKEIGDIFGIQTHVIPENSNAAHEHLRSINAVDFDLVLDCTGSPRGLELGILASRKGGRLIEVGSFAYGTHSLINPSIITRKEVDIIGSLMAPPLAYNKVIRLLRANRQYDLGRLTTHHIPLNQMNDVLDVFASQNYIKIHIEPIAA